MKYIKYTTSILALSTALLGGCVSNSFRVSPVLDHPKEVSDTTTSNRDGYLKPIDLTKEAKDVKKDDFNYPFLIALADAKDIEKSIYDTETKLAITKNTQEILDAVINAQTIVDAKQQNYDDKNKKKKNYENMKENYKNKKRNYENKKQYCDNEHANWQAAQKMVERTSVILKKMADDAAKPVEPTKANDTANFANANDKKQAEANYQAAKKKSDDAKNKSDIADKEFKTAENEFKVAEKELEDSEKEFKATEKELVDAEKELETAKREMLAAKEKKASLPPTANVVNNKAELETLKQKILAASAPRNRLQSMIIEHSDEMCEKHKGDIVGTAAGSNLLLSIGATAFSGVSAIVTGAAATNYATTATVLNGTRSELNAEIYQGMLATAIIKAINENRQTKKEEILTNQKKSPSEYSVNMAINDAQDYHFRCSFYNGLVVLNKDAKERAGSSREEIRAKITQLEEDSKKYKEAHGLGIKDEDEVTKKMTLGVKALVDKLNVLDQGK